MAVTTSNLIDTTISNLLPAIIACNPFGEQILRYLTNTSQSVAVVLRSQTEDPTRHISHCVLARCRNPTVYLLIEPRDEDAHAQVRPDQTTRRGQRTVPFLD